MVQNNVCIQRDIPAKVLRSLEELRWMYQLDSIQYKYAFLSLKNNIFYGQTYNIPSTR